MKTFLKGYCCYGKIRVEMCQKRSLHVQNVYLVFLPSFCLWFFLFPQLVVCKAVHDPFFCHILLASFCLSRSSSFLQFLFIKTSLYVFTWIFSLFLCHEIPSSHSDFHGSSFCEGNCAQSSVPHSPRCSVYEREEFTVLTTTMKLASLILSSGLITWYPNPVALFVPVPFYLTQSQNFILLAASFHMWSSRVSWDIALSWLSSGHSTVPVNTILSLFL